MSTGHTSTGHMRTRAATRRPVPDDLFGGRLRGAFLLDLEVVAVDDLAPRLRQLTFASSDLVDFAWEAGQDLMLAVPDGDRTVRRRYTIRSADPAAGTLDIQAVLHGDGPFARWAATATAGAGARIEGIGPRGAITLDPDAAAHVLVGDETAIPVTLAMLEAAPAGVPATAVLAAGDDCRVPVPDGLAVTWVAEDELPDALGRLEPPAGTAAYVNGERSLVRRAAAALTGRGVPADAVRTKAYWRRDQANAAHGEPARD